MSGVILIESFQSWSHCRIFVTLTTRSLILAALSLDSDVFLAAISLRNKYRWVYKWGTLLTSLIQQVTLANDLPSNIPADLLACREAICHAMSGEDELLSNSDEMELIK